jgi:hypothetical protein
MDEISKRKKKRGKLASTAKIAKGSSYSTRRCNDPELGVCDFAPLVCTYIYIDIYILSSSLALLGHSLKQEHTPRRTLTISEAAGTSCRSERDAENR